MVSPGDSLFSPARDSDFAAAHLFVSGLVQGVGYRYFAYQTARKLHLRGWVRNLPDGRVEAQAEGPRSALQTWIEDLKKGPSLARVDDIMTKWDVAPKGFPAFEMQ